MARKISLRRLMGGLDISPEERKKRKVMGEINKRAGELKRERRAKAAWASPSRRAKAAKFGDVK